MSRKIFVQFRNCVFRSHSFHLISSIPQILTNNNKTAVSQEENDIAEKRFTGDKPNVYFFLFDEYAGFENIEHYYDYDNQEFQIFLHRGDLIFHMEVITQSLFGHLQLYPIF